MTEDLSTAEMEHLAGREGWAILGRWPQFIKQFASGLAASVEWNVGTRTWVAKALNGSHWRTCPAGNPSLTEALDWCEAEAEQVLAKRAARKAKLEADHE